MASITGSISSITGSTWVGSTGTWVDAWVDDESQLGFTFGIINYNIPNENKEISTKNYLKFPGEGLNKIFINGDSCFFQSETKDNFTEEIIEKMRVKLYNHILNEIKIKEDELVKEKKHFNTFFQKEIRIIKLKNIL